MEDVDVGKLWRRPYDMAGQALIIALIRKLVEERAKAYRLVDMVACRVRYDQEYQVELIRQGCHDFGIDPKTYKEDT